MKNKVIIFSGLDCSGKSTQINILKNTLTKLGLKPFVFWSRGGYTPNIQSCKNIIRFFLNHFYLQLETVHVETNYFIKRVL